MCAWCGCFQLRFPNGRREGVNVLVCYWYIFFGEMSFKVFSLCGVRVRMCSTCILVIAGAHTHTLVWRPEGLCGGWRKRLSGPITLHLRQGFLSHLCLAELCLQVHANMPGFLCGCYGFELRSSCLYSMHSYHVISPASHYIIINSSGS